MTLTGIGNATFPTSSADGSGDKAPTLLPLAMQVAAQTIGLDLVPVVPMAGPMGLLSYLDFVYEGGALSGANGKFADGSVAPTYVKATAGATLVDATYATKLSQTSRIDGKDIWKIEDAGQAAIDAGTVANVEALFSAVSGLSLVAALEDHIPGFSGANANGAPMSRGLGESTPDKVMGLSLFSKSVAAETFQVAAAVTREQVQDLKQFGVDAVAQVEAVLTNELTQSINNHILAKIESLAGDNVTKSGINLDFNANAALAGGETKADKHRQILTNILAAANLIAQRGRRGAGNFAVVGGAVASAIQSVAGFVAYPMANTVNQVAGAIYPLGSIAGINVYTDPTRAFASDAVIVGRKGDGNGPGLVFMPYLMAESVQAIVEGTMAPKVAVKSRYALVEAGFHPETQYFSFNCGNNGAFAL